jgi:hypothetical protein
MKLSGTLIAKIILSRRSFFFMKCCAVLLLLCILVIGPVHAAITVNNCSGTVMSGEGAEVRINTVPDTIRVTIDGNLIGATPFEENIGLKGYSYGTHTLILAAPGYDTVTTYFGLCYGKMTDVRVDMYKTVPVTTKTTVITVATPPLSGSRAKMITAEDEQVPVSSYAIVTPPRSTGSLSVTTTPPGVEVFLDGGLRGISPITLDNIGPGTHSLLLKREGYADSTVPVMIAAGQTQSYSAAMVPESAAPSKTPGFEAALGIAALGAVLLLRK